VALCFVLLVVGRAFAQAPGAEKLERARAHFETGLGQFRVGNYDESVREFLAAYALDPRPALLVNVGQAYRLLGAPTKARAMFQRFLDEAPPEAPHRAEVEQLISELPSSPPKPTPSAAPLPPLAAERSPARDVRRRRRLTIGLAAAGGVLVIGGLALGLGLGLQRAPSYPSSALGTVNFAP
jgi:tetratricopeptide (TPR) repeat protein